MQRWACYSYSTLECVGWDHLKSSVGQRRRGRSHITVKICNMSEPLIETRFLICSLSLWRLIHPLTGWSNLASTWQICHFYFYFFGFRTNPDKLFPQSVNFVTARKTAAREAPSPSSSPSGSAGDLRGRVSKSPTLWWRSATQACSRTPLPFSNVNVASDRPLLANDDLWSSWGRSTEGGTNLQMLTSGAAAHPSRCCSATQWSERVHWFFHWP